MRQLDNRRHDRPANPSCHLLPISGQSAARRCPTRGHRLPIRCIAAARALPIGCPKLPKAANEASSTADANLLNEKGILRFAKCRRQNMLFPTAGGCHHGLA